MDGLLFVDAREDLFNVNLGLKIDALSYKYGFLKKNIASIFGISYRNFHEYLIGQSVLSAFRIRLLCSFFGVSPSYLLGFSIEMYEESSILCLESALWTYSHGVFILRDDNLRECFSLSVKDEYANAERRAYYFSLEQRAFIIFYINVLSLFYNKDVSSNFTFSKTFISDIKKQLCCLICKY